MNQVITSWTVLRFLYRDLIPSTSSSFIGPLCISAPLLLLLQPQLANAYTPITSIIYNLHNNKFTCTVSQKVLPP